MELKSPSPSPSPPADPMPKPQDFLNYLEIYLSKRDGVDKLLKISRYATKIILASSLLSDQPLISLLKSFESSIGISRKAFRLGKFVQDVNALRSADFRPYSLHLALSLIAYGGEGFYYFIEQFVWLGKSGLIDKKHLPALQKWSAWCELVGYFGSVSLKVIELRRIGEEERSLISRGEGEIEEVRRKLREKKRMKSVSLVQDLADGLMALADIRDGRGVLSAPLLVSCAGLSSGLISAHKNWVSCSP